MFHGTKNAFRINRFDLVKSETIKFALIPVRLVRNKI